ncbi:hypothetical protein [Antrihabitans cavernicola]|uniref:Yip1 domain-containing protein n=1 Tax=Antrihabitans cavernicola TaxID=2495913 RepID=A0A5A7S5X3_9NOCA|nr:hypothetical protein [Spelaeibacter cavernicola]KAA0018937.1 hypothetical protein FOY51_23150 [Spelaeibacter cavernicola]
MTFRNLLRHARYALTAPPRSVVAVTQSRDYRVLINAVLAGCVGLLAWFLAFLAVLGAFRGIFYPLIDDDSYAQSWGGPTLAGAWAVHALAVFLVPVFGLAIAAIGILQLRLARRLLDRSGPIWPVPFAVVLLIGGLFFFVSWLHQAQ